MFKNAVEKEQAAITEEEIYSQLDYLQLTKKNELSISRSRFIERLKALGYGAAEVSRGNFTLVKRDGYIIEQVEKPKIVNDFLDHLRKHLYKLDEWFELKNSAGNSIFFPLGAVEDKVLAGIDTYFKDSLLLTALVPADFNSDTEEEGYFYYEDAYLRITGDTIERLEYRDLKRFIWRNQILSRKAPTFSKSLDDDLTEGHFGDFVYRVAGQDEKRLFCFTTMIGNGLHRYNGRKRVSVNLTDMNLENTGQPEGRSGKTLIVQGIGHMLNASDQDKCYCEVAGKNFKSENKNRYQKAEINTTLICINDLPDRFDVRGLFNDITDGVEVDKRYATNVFMIYPKIYTSSNEPLRLIGGSSRARFVEYEASNYFSENHTPEDEYGAWFFSKDWNEGKQWEKFDRFMAYCLKSYLKHGLQAPLSINLHNRKLWEHTSPEFASWAEDNIKAGGEYVLSALFDSFIQQTGQDWMKQNTFTRWVKLYGEHTPQIHRIDVKYSNGVGLATAIPKGQKQ